jgi:hypothetical protein
MSGNGPVQSSATLHWALAGGANVVTLCGPPGALPCAASAVSVFASRRGIVRSLLGSRLSASDEEHPPIAEANAAAAKKTNRVARAGVRIIRSE